MKLKALFASLIVTTLAFPVHAQQKTRMYKCVDKAGKVYYSDKANPDCNKGTELNRQGVVVSPKKTEKPASALKTETAKPEISKEQQRRDRALMATYTSETEIDTARDRSMAPLLEGTKAVETKLTKVNENLVGLRAKADALAAQKKPLPAALLDDVNDTQKEVAMLDADLAQRNAQIDAIRARYEAHKQRFHQLKGTAQ